MYGFFSWPADSDFHSKFHPCPIQFEKLPCSWAVFCCRCTCLVLTCSYCDEQWQASSLRNAPGALCSPLALLPQFAVAAVIWDLFLSIFSSKDVLQCFPLCLPHSCGCSLFLMHALRNCDESVHLGNEWEKWNCAMSVWSHGHVSSWMLPIYIGILTKHGFEDYLLWIWWLLHDYKY